MSEALSQNDRSARVLALFEQLFESSPDAILVTAADGQNREANLQAERLFGYSRGELIATTIETLIPERFRKHHSQYHRGYHVNPHARPMGAGLDLFAKRRDGSEFPVDIMLSPVQTEDGQVALAVVRDITERKQTQVALRRSEERFRLLIDGARDYAIFMLDPAGNVASWNPGAERIKGYRADEIVGQHFSRFYSQEDVERGKPEAELQIARTEGRYEEEGWRIRKDGSRFWANVIITSLRDNAGNLIGFSKATRDFTNRHKAEESLLLELSQAMLAGLDITKLLGAIAAGIQNIAPNDYALLALYDSNAESLRLQELIPPKDSKQPEEKFLPIEGTPLWLGLPEPTAALSQ